MTARKYDPVCSYPGCGRAHNAKGLCGPHGTMHRKGKALRPILTRTGPVEIPAVDRFAAKVALAPSGCLEWMGSTNPGGYGSFAARPTSVDSKRVMAHRWSYEHHVGPIPSGLDLDHLCRNRKCVNPAHLEPVTRSENVRRAVAANAQEKS